MKCSNHIMDTREKAKEYISNAIDSNENNLLSIVIITCNRKDELIKSVESCVSHTMRVFELIIVDNNSTDNTEYAIREYCEKQTLLLKYIKLEKNVGVSVARNIGFNCAKGDIVFFIDDDAVVISDEMSLDAVCDYMRNEKYVFATTGSSYDYRYGGLMKFVKDKKDNRADKYNIRSYVGFNHFVKKAITNKDFIYPSNLFYGSEELYVGFLALKKGGYVTYFSNHSVQHNPSLNTRINRREGLLNGYINTFVIKKYFLPAIYRFFSKVFFWFRVLKFCKFNVREISFCLKESKKRYDKTFDNKMSIKQVKEAIARFGALSII